MYKIGDKIKIKDIDNLDGSKAKSGIYFASEMLQYCGKTLIVKRISKYNGYSLPVTSHGLHDWTWDENWIEQKKEKVTITVGDLV